jgi:hypothetical protein
VETVETEVACVQRGWDEFRGAFLSEMLCPCYGEIDKKMKECREFVVFAMKYLVEELRFAKDDWHS